MVLAFQVVDYDKDTNVQTDYIMIKDGEEFKVQGRMELEPFFEATFDHESDAYRAFDKLMKE